ncbi:hypothetical protein Tco_0245768 [Tanacetum coccineum]
MYDIGSEELKAYLDLVPREDFAMEIDSLGQWKFQRITRIFSEILDDFDRLVVNRSTHTSSKNGMQLQRPQKEMTCCYGEI